MGLTLTKKINIELPKDEIKKCIDEMIDTMLFNNTDGMFTIDELDSLQKVTLYRQIINTLKEQ